MIPRQLRKPWFGTAIWLALVYLSFRNIDNVARVHSPGWLLLALTVAHGALVLLITYAIVAASDKAVAHTPPAPTPRFRERVYLVVHLSLKVSPPVATFVQIYSNSAKDITLVGIPEVRADLYVVEADAFQEALDEMERIVPLYFPWAIPLMVRNR